jgi:hypothetical protein
MEDKMGIWNPHPVLLYIAIYYSIGYTEAWANEWTRVECTLERITRMGAHTHREWLTRKKHYCPESETTNSHKKYMNEERSTEGVLRENGTKVKKIGLM